MTRLTHDETEFIFQCLLDKRRSIIKEIQNMDEWPAEQRKDARHLIKFVQPLLRKLIPRQPRTKNGYPVCNNCFQNTVSVAEPVCVHCGLTYPAFNKWSIITGDGRDIGSLSGHFSSGETAVSQEAS